MRTLSHDLLARTQTSMSLREKITQNPRYGTAAAGALILIGIMIIIMQTRGGAPPDSPTQAFFTVDDGKTWFADSVSNIPPFDKDGKQAVRAFVFRCADGTVFVNHLERFKPQAKQALENVNAPAPDQTGHANLAAIQGAYTGGREVKRPGDAKWTDAGNFREAGQIMAVKCPGGGTDAMPVDP
jgi:hypothetical protein